MNPRGPATTQPLAHLTAAERALLQRVKHAVREIEPTAEIILYGSRARGDAQPDSDWDLLVLLEGEADWRRAETVANQVYDVEMSEETCPVLSTIVRGRAAWESPLSRAMPYYQNVGREGVVL